MTMSDVLSTSSSCLHSYSMQEIALLEGAVYDILALSVGKSVSEAEFW